MWCVWISDFWEKGLEKTVPSIAASSDFHLFLPDLMGADYSCSCWSTVVWDWEEKNRKTKQKPRGRADSLQLLWVQNDSHFDYFQLVLTLLHVHSSLSFSRQSVNQIERRVWGFAGLPFGDSEQWFQFQSIVRTWEPFRTAVSCPHQTYWRNRGTVWVKTYLNYPTKCIARNLPFCI